MSLPLWFQINSYFDGGSYILPPTARIRESEMLMGSDPLVDTFAESNEIPQHKIWVPDFEMALYPVTVYEYSFAIEAAIVKAPHLWQNQQKIPANAVVNVSWFDCMFYSIWLSNSSGYHWALPNEAQWEKAARGETGLIYPWGNEWHNDIVENPHFPAFGQDPNNISPYGIYDMVGSIYHWCSSRHGPYPFDPTDGRESWATEASMRSVRGGFGYRISLSLWARAARRGFHQPPYNIDNLYGFRLIKRRVHHSYNR